MTVWPETDDDLAEQARAEGLEERVVSRTNRQRPPPSDDQAEQAVLGAALISTEALHAAADTGLQPHHFHRPRHQAIWSALQATGAADHVLVSAWLRDHDQDDPQALNAILASDIPGTSNAAHYAERVVGLAELRQLIGDAHELEAGAYADDRDRIARALERLTARRVAGGQSSTGSLIEWETLFDRSLDNDWLLEPLLATARGHALYAGQKAGKSLLVASVLVPAAMGRPVLERRTCTPLRTLYLDFEMTREDVAERVEAMGFGPHNAAELEPLAYHVLPAIPPLDTAAGGQMILAWALEHRADLVVFDTMARAVAGAENDADTYRDYYRHTGSILKGAGIATLRLDHSGKETDRGQRGSSAKADDVDVVWRLTAREANQFTLDCTHRRMGWIPHKVQLARHPDPLRYLQVTDTYPAGTKEAADALAEIGAPLDITRRAARALFQEHGYTARTEALAAAIKYRRDGMGRGMGPDTGYPDGTEGGESGNA